MLHRPIPVSPSPHSIARCPNQKSLYGQGTRKYPGTPHPCYQCGLVVEDKIKHILNDCDKFHEQGRYTWRRNCVLHYLDSLLDHNKFRVFCDLPDRRTSSGKLHTSIT